MTLIHAWNNLEYGFDCPEDYEYAIQSRSYIEEGFKRPYDVDMGIDRNNKVVIFISTPRIVNGIPYTLAKVSNKRGKYGPLLLPYPDFEAHSERDNRDCNRIISVFRVFVDPCNRLWAIDTGRNFSAMPSQVCPPKIVVIDLKTDTIIFKYTIPKNQYTNQTVHNGIIVNIYDPPPKGRCEQGKVYITDARGFSFLVFDVKLRQSWVIFNDLFKPDPAYLNTTINGETFTFPDGLYTSTPDLKRGLIYLHSHASRSELAAKLKDVNNREMWKNSPSGYQDAFKVIGTRRTQCPVQALDFCGNNLYFSQYDPVSIQSWNPDKSYEPANFKILVVNNQTLPFVAGMKVVYGRDGKEYLLVMSNNLQKLNTGSIRLDEINFRCLVCLTSTLQSGIGPCVKLSSCLLTSIGAKQIDIRFIRPLNVIVCKDFELFLKMILILLFIPVSLIGLTSSSLETIAEWKIVDFGFLHLEEINLALRNGQLDHKNANLFDVDVDYDVNGERRIFVTIPRLKEGIPYSLAVVEPKQRFYNQSSPSEKIIGAYPSYSWHSSYGNDCNGITSAIRVAIDQCHRLWVLDTGTIESRSLCPPQILVFDLATNTLIHRHRLPLVVYRKDASRLVNLIVDISDPAPNGLCWKALVFIADTGFHGLIAYDVASNHTWRIENKLMFPDPDFGTFSIAGEKVDIMDGIVGMSITPRHFRGERFFYFSSLSSEIESVVPLRILLNQTIWNKHIKVPREFFPIGQRGVQCSNQAMDSKGNIYCVTMDEVSLISWSIRDPYAYHYFNVLANDVEQLQFATGIKVVRNAFGKEELWILTSRYQKALTRTRNFNEVNFRIITCEIEHLQDRTSICGLRKTTR
ncbi:uncharacterized protein LOC129945820 [Eupeodes corollae]|uniref:uncharacterized protein LOC129945820 n=1 Tax=Eupeodes corollae TaxID=290404 RepID=UPI0024937A4D|nr:uncharacterized protein LOC129945820 [Eupeodes corollae]